MSGPGAALETPLVHSVWCPEKGQGLYQLPNTMVTF